MADEKLNLGPDEVNAAEPEVAEQATGDSPPEAAAPEPEQAEPGMDNPSAGEPPGEEHEPDAPGDTPPQEADVQEAEQPEVAGAVVEDAPAQESLFGDGTPASDGPVAEPPAAEEPEVPAPGDDGEVVVPFEKISELIGKEPGIIAFFPEQYLLQEHFQGKVLPTQNITPSEFFGGTKWYPTATPAPIFGLIPLLLGTLLVSIGAIVLSLPFGLAVAIYMAEIANHRMRDFLKPIIELLAGIPSVVYGFFGLVVIVPLIQKTFDLPVGETAFAGSVVLAIMALPTIITVAEDAMRTTPRAMKEASLALGATQWQTIYKVIIPYSISGITSAVVLGIGRAIGETMAVLMVTGNAAVIPTSFFEPVRTIPATIAAELGEAPAGGAHYEALFLLGVVLFLITLLLSISVEYISSKRKI